MAAKEKSKRWRGIEVDAGLEAAWLRKLNSIPGARVISTCEGHGKGSPPHFVLSFRGLSGEEKAMGLARKLRGPGTHVEVDSWGGPQGTWVVRVNGRWRKGADRKNPVRTVSLYVQNAGRKSPGWWEKTLTKI